MDDIADGSAGTRKRARVADNLDAMSLTPAQKMAALIYRQAWRHVSDGKGMGPLPFARDITHAGIFAVHLCEQERAVSSAEWYRRGANAAGISATQGVLMWVVIAGLPIAEYAKHIARRLATVRGMLLDALDRMADAYRC